MDLQIKDHVFMVSGGSRGIRFEITEQAAQEGAVRDWSTASASLQRRQFSSVSFGRNVTGADIL